VAPVTKTALPVLSLTGITLAPLAALATGITFTSSEAAAAPSFSFAATTDGSLISASIFFCKVSGLPVTLILLSDCSFFPTLTSGLMSSFFTVFFSSEGSV